MLLKQEMIRKWDVLKKLKLTPMQFDVVMASMAAFLEPVWNYLFKTLLSFIGIPKQASGLKNKIKGKASEVIGQRDLNNINVKINHTVFQDDDD